MKREIKHSQIVIYRANKGKTLIVECESKRTANTIYLIFHKIREWQIETPKDNNYIV